MELQVVKEATGFPKVPVKGMYFEFVENDSEDANRMLNNCETLKRVLPYSTGPLTFQRGRTLPFLALRTANTVTYPASWWDKFFGMRDVVSTVVNEYGRSYIFDPLSTITPSVLIFHAEQLVKSYYEKALIEKQQLETARLERRVSELFGKYPPKRLDTTRG